MRIIAKNEFYEIEYDEIKNRIIYKVLGYWQNSSVVPHYLEDMEKVLKLAKPNYTFIANLSEAKTHPKEVMELREKAQKMVKNEGLFRIATVLSTGVFSQIQLELTYQKNKMPKNTFYSLKMAHKWLDEEEKLQKQE